MENRSILSPRITIPRTQAATKENRPGRAAKVVMVGGAPVTLKWVKSLQCWCADPNGLLKARREKAAQVVTGGSPWRLPPGRIQRRRTGNKRALRS